MSRCAVCDHPKLAETVAKVKTNEMTVDDAARTLGVSYQLMWRHLRYHEDVKATYDLSKIEDVDTLGILRQITMILKDRLDKLKDLKIGVMQERMLNSNVNALRATLMDLEKLTGRLRTAPILQLQQVNIYYEKVVEFLIQELCPECRRKAVKHLEQVMKQW